MEEIDIEEEGESIYNQKEYNIKEKNNKYHLRLETKEKSINIIISMDNNLEYYYKIKMSLSTIAKKLELNSKKYSNFELVLKLFDELYEHKKIFIYEDINGESCILIIKSTKALIIKDYEIRLDKNYRKIEDKFNILYNKFKLIQNSNIDDDKITSMNNKIIELTNKLEQRDNEIKEIKEIINIKDNAITEINKKLVNLENKVKILENKNINLNDKSNNKQEKDDIKINDKISIQNNNINNNINQIDEIKMKFKEQQKINDKIFNIALFDNKKYEYKVNYDFKNNPKNLEFIDNITKENTSAGRNDMFEIFISYIDKKEYLVSPNAITFNLDIYSLSDNRIIRSLSRHKNKIRVIRYFLNDKNKKEYLISADDDRMVFIWDITHNYENLCQYNTKYDSEINSCLMIFPHNSEENFVITSTFGHNGKDEDSATKVFSLEQKKQIIFSNFLKFLKFLQYTNDNPIYHLLSWYNNRYHKYYIIQFSNNKIILSNLLEDESHQLINKPESEHFSGCIYCNNNIDYICASSKNGYINIWNLFEKTIYKTIDTKGCKLSQIIKWNQKYIIVADSNNKSLKIIDMDNNSIVDFGTTHTNDLNCIKKINHPIYGESLLTAAEDNKITLWAFK